MLKALKQCSVLNGITQSHLPPTRFIPASAEQDLAHYIRNKLVNVANDFTDLGRMEAWVKLSAREWSWTSTVHDWTFIWVGALTNWASQADYSLGQMTTKVEKKNERDMFLVFLWKRVGEMERGDVEDDSANWRISGGRRFHNAGAVW